MKKLFVISFVVLLVSCQDKRTVTTGLEGKPLPVFNILLTDSTTYVSTQNAPKGKAVVLFYFNPHCPYCMAQMEEMSETVLRNKEIQFYIFTTWPFNQMKDFSQRFKLKQFDNVTAGVDYKDFFVHHFKVTGAPYTAIYNKDGKLNKAFLGQIDPYKIKEIAEK